MPLFGFDRSIVPVVLGVLCALAGTATAQTAGGRQPVARLAGEAIYEDDLLPSIGGQLWQLKNQEYELKRKALESVISKRVVENAAKAKGLSTEEFLQENVDRHVPPPSPAELQAYYLAQKERIGRPLAEVKAQVEQSLILARQQEARQEYADELRKKADLVVLLERPRVNLVADTQRLRGSGDAPITIIEFSDYQCPYCKAAEPVLKEVMDKYKGKVRLGFLDFPLRQIHPQAQQAAEAARCAGEQGKYWEYHDLLYANQAKLDQAGLTEQAKAAGLEMQQFSGCLTSGKFRRSIEKDLQAGSIAGVSGTPAFYINGVFLNGAQPVTEFQKLIDAELTAKK